MKNYIAFENNEEGNVWTSEYVLSIKWKKIKLKNNEYIFYSYHKDDSNINDKYI